MVLLDELREQQSLHENKIITDAQEIFTSEVSEENRIIQALYARNDYSSEIHTLGQNIEIFDLQSIKKICLDYRLRFLDSRLFKDEIPFEAVLQIKELEKKLKIQLKHFKIIAPENKFLLKDSQEDPILLAQLSENKFLYIHHWGNDLSPFRKVLNYPFRNIQTLTISSIILSLLMVLISPLFYVEPTVNLSVGKIYLQKSMMFFTLSGLLFGMGIIGGIINGKEFSEDVWDDKYFN